MKIMITGDSHTAALKLGAKMLMGEGYIPEHCQIEVQPLGGGGSLTVPFFVDKGDCAEMINEKHQGRIKRLPFSSDQGQYDYYGICGPLHSTRIWKHRHYWQNYTPFTLQGDQAPVSSSLLRHVVLQEQVYTLQLLELLKRVGVKVFVIEAPKPFRHHPVLEQVSHEAVAYVDGFYRKVMQEWLAAKDVPVINAPGTTYDADGFTYATFRNDNPEDDHHGNRQFGVVMMKEIIGFLKSCD